MSKKEIRQIYEELSGELLSHGFLERTGLRRETVQLLLNREYWEGRLKELFPIKRRFTCRELFELCRGGMALLGPEPEEGWMPFTYQYVCHILYPDESFDERNSHYQAGALYYLTVLRFFFDRERKVVPFEPMRDFAFLTPEEAAPFEAASEYRKFLRVWHEEFIYEMMRLNAEVTRFNTLEHIAGVHYVAMTIARGLYQAGAPIDLTLISGAAAGHDLGKFGCKPNEQVPYMHYYYTDLWFNRHNMHYIGQIAANHSTWDLEPENLSVESLTLIYSDFRVKISRGADGREITRISSLKEAFDVILNKLSNVDAKKLLRYRFVYAKLQDFERYMISQGVDVNLDGKPQPPAKMPEPVLRTPEQIVDSLVFMAIEHNVDVMHRMTAERQFGNLLEAARTEKNWKNVRAYLNILREYFTYTNDVQKEQMLSFLYELFMHRDGEIRIQAAELLGEVLAQFNAGYRKRRPEGMKDVAQEKVLSLWKRYMELVICPDHKLIDIQQQRIQSQLKNIVAALVPCAEAEDLPMYMDALMDWYRNPEERKPGESFVLLNTVEVLPYEKLGEEDLTLITRFAAAKQDAPEQDVHTAAWRAFKQLTDYARTRAEEQGIAPEHAGDDLPWCAEIEEAVRARNVAGNTLRTFLKFRVLSNLGRDTSDLKKRLYGDDVLTDIFLDNLKTNTPWICQAVNIKLLADQVEHLGSHHGMHIAAHLSNMIKVGQYMLVRSTAGEALVRIAPLLRADQRNEISVELLRGLETGETDYSRSIPHWLGQLVLWLPPEQLDEMIGSLEGLMASPSDQVTSVALDTVGTILEHYPAYRERFEESEGAWKRRWHHLVGVLLTGMANYREKVRQEALLVLGQRVFGSPNLSRSQKYTVFRLCFRKLLFQLTENQGGELTHFYRAASLSNLYRFITAYRLLDGDFEIPEREKVAFFPGTFDPFTLSHKGIACMIRDMGFEVYLSVDEFSWSKKAQPHFIRRQIAGMSVADEFHINIFPYQLPFNPGNPSDLEELKRIFAGREVYLVTGSDVIAHASFYRGDTDASRAVRAMNHIAFRRVGDREADSRYNREMMDSITGKLVELELPPELEEISSTRIRENIDMNRDISNLIDPVVQEYIYNNGLYLREPEYKPIIQARAVGFEEIATPFPAILTEIGEELLSEEDADVRRRLLDHIRTSGDRLLLLRNSEENNRLVAAARIRYLAPDRLFPVLKMIALTDMVRSRTSGEVLMISGIYVGQNPGIHDAEQLLLAEAIIRSFEHRCDLAIFYPDGEVTDRVLSAVRRHGFVQAPEAGKELLWIVDMHAPLLLLANMETTLKEPFSSNTRVLRAIRRAQIDLQISMTKLYPGQLVLSVSATVLYHRLVDKITAENRVPREAQVPRKLGELMCVPFGKILRGKVVPNTVTKTLHTDRVYEPDLKSSEVEAFPNYTPLETQVRAIKSFRRPVILVDDVMNRSGIRINRLEPLFRDQGVEIRKVILGVMSGYGRDILTTLKLDADSVYYIPNMRYWFVESSLYPFIGGDTVRRNTMKVAGLAPSINMIRPYTQPPLPDADDDALFEFSATCIRNARDVLLVLEQEYRARFARNLTLSRLSEAVILPLCPDKGECVGYDPNLAASVYLENDLEQLCRTRVDTRASTNHYKGKKGIV